MEGLSARSTTFPSMQVRFQSIDTLAAANPLLKATGIGAAKKVKISQSEACGYVEFPPIQ